MPGILQLPPLLNEDERTAGARSNGAPRPRQASLQFPKEPQPAEDHLENLFVLLDDPSSEAERERLRMREALWVSLVIHGVVLVLLIFFMPKWIVQHAPSSLQRMLMNNDITFLEMPPTPETEKPKTADRISDQNRVASVRRPDEKTLKELHDSNLRPATPPQAQPQAAQPAQQPSPAAPQSPAMRAAQQGQPAQGTPAQPLRTSPNGQTSAQMASLPQRTGSSQNSPFNTALSAGSQIQQALKASAGNRAAGVAPDVGTPSLPAPAKLGSGMEVLSDTMGVDFGPYLSRVLEEVRRNWYSIIPEEARPPLMKQGKVTLEFVIMKDGTVKGLIRDASSGDIALDRAAMGSITTSDPFQPLPPEFRGEYLKLRFYYLYNPSRNDLQ